MVIFDKSKKLNLYETKNSEVILKINRFSLWMAFYDIQDENKNTILKIRGPCCICDGACCPCDNEFKVIKKLFEKTIEFEI